MTCPFFPHSLPSLLASLILSLRGKDAIQAVNVIINCVSPSGGGAIADQVEDGEISVELTARQLLLEASRLVMVGIFAAANKSVADNFRELFFVPSEQDLGPVRGV